MKKSLLHIDRDREWGGASPSCAHTQLLSSPHGHGSAGPRPSAAAARDVQGRLSEVGSSGAWLASAESASAGMKETQKPCFMLSAWGCCPSSIAAWMIMDDELFARGTSMFSSPSLPLRSLCVWSSSLFPIHEFDPSGRMASSVGPMVSGLGHRCIFPR